MQPLSLFAAEPVNTANVFIAYGPLGAAVVVMGGVIYFLYKENKSLQNRLYDVQEERLRNAIETRDKLAEPMENMTKLMQNILNVVTNGKQ